MGKAIIIKGADFSRVAIASNAVPVTGLAITGASGSQTQRQVQLSVSYTPADTTQLGVVWSVVSGNASITSEGLLTYNGSAASASVVVKVTSTKNSNVSAQATFTFALPAVEAPTFSPAQGTYNQVQNVALRCATAGATIYYTTDGSTPFPTSTRYSSPIAVNSSMTIKAIAVKNGQSSEVATASYTIEILHSVTVNVSDGTDPVSGATVKLTRGGVDRTPTSTSGGSYMFNVPDGTYTLSVDKRGYDSHTEQVIVNGQDVVVVVVVVQIPTEIDLFNEGLRLLPLWLYAFSSTYNASLFTLDGHGLTDHSSGKKRFSAAALRSETEHPCTWTAMTPDTTDEQKALYSLFEIDQRYPYIKAEVTNSNYNVSIKLAAGDVTAYFNDIDVTSGANPGWANSILMKNTYTGGPVYLTVNFRKSGNGQVTVLPTVSEMGLTVKAYQSDPRT
jgi:hypothetical protein